MGSIFGMHRLLAHPSTPPVAISNVSANVLSYTAEELVIEYSVIADGTLLLPPETEPDRADELWQTTCFELFLRSEAGKYAEFNFSPSFAWAAYSFEKYRDGMKNLALSFDPEIGISPSQSHFFLCVELPNIGAEYQIMGLTAVIEEVDGTKSYWALAHPDSPPDFHHPDCFALALPPVGQI
jgi:hypothetical protein